MHYKDLARDDRGRVISEEVCFPVQYPLLTPLESDARAEPLAELELREPVAREVEAANAEKTGTATVMRLVSLSAGLSMDEVRSLGLRDYNRISSLLLDFN